MVRSRAASGLGSQLNLIWLRHTMHRHLLRRLLCQLLSLDSISNSSSSSQTYSNSCRHCQQLRSHGSSSYASLQQCHLKPAFAIRMLMPRHSCQQQPRWCRLRMQAMCTIWLQLSSHKFHICCQQQRWRQQYLLQMQHSAWRKRGHNSQRQHQLWKDRQPAGAFCCRLHAEMLQMMLVNRSGGAPAAAEQIIKLH